MLHRLVLWVWRWVPMPEWVRWLAVWAGNQKFLIGVAAFIKNERGEVLLFHHPYRVEYPWSIPGGYLKRRESAERCIEREVLEETGLRVRMSGPLEVWCSENFPRVDMVYLGTLESGEFRPSAEVSDARWFSLRDLPEVSPRQRELIRRVLSGSGERAQSGSPGEG